MFCDGKCKTEVETENGTLVKKCGLHRTLIVKDRNTEEVAEHEMCLFEAMMNSLHRLEDVSVVQAQTLQEQRNEGEEQATDIAKTIATGFLGMIHSMGDDDKKVKIINTLKQIELKE